MTDQENHADCSATVTLTSNVRGAKLYRVTPLPDATQRVFERAQDAADWIAIHLPSQPVK